MCPFKKAFPFVILLHFLLVMGIFVGYAERHTSPAIFTLLPAIGVGEDLKPGQAVNTLAQDPSDSDSVAPSKAQDFSAEAPAVTETSPAPKISLPAPAGGVAADTPSEQAAVGSALQSESVGNKIIPPIALKRVIPHRSAGVQKGQVVLSFTIDAAGRVEGVSVERSSSPQMTEAVLAVLPQWRFTPAKEDGKAIALKVRQVVEF